MNGIDRKDPPAPPPQRPRKFYAEDVAEWRIFHARSWSYRQIGLEYGVSPATVCLALSGKYPVRILSRGQEAAEKRL